MVNWLAGQALQFLFDAMKLVAPSQVQLAPVAVEAKVRPFLQLHLPLVIVPSKLGSLVVTHWKHVVPPGRMIACTVDSQRQVDLCALQT